MDQSLIELHRVVLSDSGLSVRQRRALLNDIRKLIPPDQNRWNLRWVIFPLALIGLSLPAVFAIHVVYLGQFPEKVPEGLVSLASAAVGALAGFLTPYIRKSDEAPASPSSATGNRSQTPPQDEPSPSASTAEGAANAAGR